MLRIRKGSEIYAYGKGCEAFTDQSELSQPILEHLKTRFPNEVEVVEIKKEKQKANK